MGGKSQQNVTWRRRPCLVRPRERTRRGFFCLRVKQRLCETGEGRDHYGPEHCASREGKREEGENASPIVVAPLREVSSTRASTFRRRSISIDRTQHDGVPSLPPSHTRSRPRQAVRPACGGRGDGNTPRRRNKRAAPRDSARCSTSAVPPRRAFDARSLRVLLSLAATTPTDNHSQKSLHQHLINRHYNKQQQQQQQTSRSTNTTYESSSKAHKHSLASS